MLTEPIYATGDLEIKGKVSDLNSEKSTVLLILNYQIF